MQGLTSRVSGLVTVSVGALILVACGAVSPATSLDDGRAEPRIVAAERTPRVSATPTPDKRPLIDELILTTEVDDHGIPVDDRTALPANAAVAYLVVRARHIEPGARFEAEWLRDKEPIGRSEQLARGNGVGEQWVPLRFAPEGGFPFGSYSVRLSVDGQFIESLVFRAGGGGSTQAVSAPRLILTDQWTSGQASISSRTRFEADTRQVVAVLTSAAAVPSGDLVSYWQHGDEFVAEIPPDGRLSAGVRTFTLQRGDPLGPGEYQVTVTAGGQHVAAASFMVQGVQESEPEPDPSTTVVQFVVTPDIDDVNRTPSGNSVERVTPPLDIFGMVLVENLESTDVLEMVWMRNGETVATSQLTDESLNRSWVRFRYALPVEEGGGDAEYLAIVRLNGEEVAEHQFIATRPD